MQPLMEETTSQSTFRLGGSQTPEQTWHGTNPHSVCEKRPWNFRVSATDLFFEYCSLRRSESFFFLADGTMRVTFKTLGGSQLVKEFSAETLISVVKDALAGEEGYDRSGLRLCFKGKVLEDGVSIAGSGINEGDTLIIAGKKAGAAPAAKPAQPAPALPAQSAVPSSGPAPGRANPAAPPVASQPRPLFDEATVGNIVAMGFPQEEVQRALVAAYGNADRAVDYLINGIPAGSASAGPPPPPQPSAVPSTGLRLPPGSIASGVRTAPVVPSGRENFRLARQASHTGEADDMYHVDHDEDDDDDDEEDNEYDEEEDMTPLEAALYNLPEFNSMRERVRADPGVMPGLMSQLQAEHPDVFQLVQANPSEFLEILNREDIVEADGEGGQEIRLRPDGTLDVDLSAEENAAVDRLVALGGGAWDRTGALMVYAFCGKNEEAAANVLFDNGGVPADMLSALLEGGGDQDSGDSGPE
jgi:UV excision repair protein RAD23